MVIKINYCKSIYGWALVYKNHHKIHEPERGKLSIYSSRAEARFNKMEHVKVVKVIISSI